MKKALSLILVLVLCLGLCACGGSESAPTNNDTTATEQSTESTESFVSEIMNDRKWYCFQESYDTDMYTRSDGSCGFSADKPMGIWEINGESVTLSWEDSPGYGAGSSTQYRLEQNNNAYFLVGDTYIFSSVPFDELKTNTIEITLDNWDDYFEIQRISFESVNAFGEVDKTETHTLLVLKEAYVNNLLASKSSIACLFTYDYPQGIGQFLEFEGRVRSSGYYASSSDYSFSLRLPYDINEFGEPTLTRIDGKLVFLEEN